MKVCIYFKKITLTQFFWDHVINARTVSPIYSFLRGIATMKRTRSHAKKLEIIYREMQSDFIPPYAAPTKDNLAKQIDIRLKSLCNTEI